MKFKSCLIFNST